MSTISVRSIVDPSRVLVYRDAHPSKSVFGPDAANHVLVGKDHVQSTMLGSSPRFDTRRPSFWRRAAIKAVAHVLVHLVYPRARSSMLDEHLKQHRSGKVRGFCGGKHGLLVEDHPFEFFDDDHGFVLRIYRVDTETRVPRSRKAGAA